MREILSEMKKVKHANKSTRVSKGRADVYIYGSSRFISKFSLLERKLGINW